MKLIATNINSVLLLENYPFKDNHNNIDYLNQLAYTENDLNKRKQLLDLAITKIEKFHSYFHFEQSFFHLQLAQELIINEKYDLAQEQIKLAIFQDPLNLQALELKDNFDLVIKKKYLMSNNYSRQFKDFNSYILFATDEENQSLVQQGYWEWANNNHHTIEILEQIIEKVKKLHLGYHYESAKFYLNRVMIHNMLNEKILAKNDLVKANNLDVELSTREYYSTFIRQSKIKVVLGLGSNLGDRKKYLEKAIMLLENLQVLENISCSSVINSKALLAEYALKEWDREYLNMAITGYTSLTPQELLVNVKKIEKMIGRSVLFRWAPREIDIDILAYSNQVINTNNLSIPHPSLLDRSWAILPFIEIYPEWKYPVKGDLFNMTLKEIYEKNKTSGNS